MKQSLVWDAFHSWHLLIDDFLPLAETLWIDAGIDEGVDGLDDILSMIYTVTSQEKFELRMPSSRNI